MHHTSLSLPFGFTLTLILLAAGPLAGAAEKSGEVAQIELPPPSIAQWYKPANKRHVWLHTMFKLREQMAAVELYAARGDAERLEKWADSLRATYASIPEMVPEWKSEVDLDAARSLAIAAGVGDLAAVKSNKTRLRRSCNACHGRWSAATTALYRSPDYSQVMLTDSRRGDEVSYREAMKRMTRALVELKIARTDGDFDLARAAGLELKARLHDLGESCAGCHRDDAPRERILGAEAFANLEALRTSMLGEHDPKQSGRYLGTLGFAVCGRCHAVHRTLGDLRNELLSNMESGGTP